MTSEGKERARWNSLYAQESLGLPGQTMIVFLIFFGSNPLLM